MIPGLSMISTRKIPDDVQWITRNVNFDHVSYSSANIAGLPYNRARARMSSQHPIPKRQKRWRCQMPMTQQDKSTAEWHFSIINVWIDYAVRFEFQRMNKWPQRRFRKIWLNSGKDRLAFLTLRMNAIRQWDYPKRDRSFHFTITGNDVIPMAELKSLWFEKGESLCN